MPALARARSSDVDTAQAAQPAQQAAVAQNVRSTARGSNAVAQDRLREAPAEGNASGTEQGGGGVTTSAPPGGGGGEGLPNAAAIGPKTPEVVLEHILYAPSGKGDTAWRATA